MTDQIVRTRPVAGPSDTDIQALCIVVAIVNYQSAELVIEGLPSLAEELAVFSDGRAIIVDNASPDGGAESLAEFLDTFPAKDRMHLVRADTNGGFAAGNNIAFRMALASGRRPDAIMLLNPDAELRPGALKTLASFLAKHPRAGVVGAALENEDGSVRPSAFRFPSIMGEFARESAFGPLQRLWPTAATVGRDTPVQADWVTGAAVLIRQSVIDDIGLMDDDFFLYFEETDFMRRARCAGWEVWHAPGARVRHRAGSSTGIVGGQPKKGRMPAYWFASWLHYFTKSHGVAYARMAAAMRLAGMGMGTVIRLLRRRTSPLAPGFAADFVRLCLLAPLRTTRNGKSVMHS